MTLKTIYIARHGYRANWLPPPHPPNPTGVDSDPPLADHGVDQAHELAAYMKTLPKESQPKIVLSSPFYRCVQTAEPMAIKLDIPIVIERGVGEWYKKDRGIVPEPADYDLLTKFFPTTLKPELWARDGLQVIPDLTGETESDIFARTQLFWSKFISVFEEKFPEIDTILIMTHAATKISLGMALLQKDGVRGYVDEAAGTRLRAGACSLDKYARTNDGKNWEILMNGNCDFLSKGEEMHWNFQSGFEAGSDEDIKARAMAKAKAEAEAATSTKLDNIDSANDAVAKASAAAILQAGAASATTSSATTPTPDSLTLAEDQNPANSDDFEEVYVTIDIPITGESKFSHFDDPSTSKSFHIKSANLTKVSVRQQQAGSQTSTQTGGPNGGSSSGNSGNSNAGATKQFTKELAQTKASIIKPSSAFQIVGLDDEHPLIKLSNNADISNSSSTAGDGKIYQGQWKKLVGTDMVFDDYGELIGVVREHLQCDESNVLIPKETPEDDDPDKVAEMEETTNLAGEEGENGLETHATTILKKAYALAKKREEKENDS